MFSTRLVNNHDRGKASETISLNAASFRVDRDEARAALFDFIEIYYNRGRDHQYLGYRSPAAFEELADVA